MMSRSKSISPHGCKECVQEYAGRCLLTGFKIKYLVNAKHHCKDFSKIKAVALPRKEQ